MNQIPTTIIRALCWTLLHSLWQGLILAIVAGAVMLLTRKARSATRYTLLATLVTGFLLVSGYTFFRELRLPIARTPVILTHVAPVADASGAPLVQLGGQAIQTSFTDQLVQYFNTHASVVVVVWFIVFMARFVKLLSGLVYAQRVRSYQTSVAPAEWQDRLAALVQRLGITRPVGLLESALIKVPVAVGWLKPVILVPVGMLAQLPADQVESIILHELAHISRRDYLFNLAQNIVDTLFFFNPALLWVSSLIRTERENCCDDVAIRESRSRRRLVEALVSFHEYQQSARGWSLGFAGEKNGLVKRVERIVRKRNHSLNPGERLLLMVGVLVLCGAFITVNREQKTVLIAAKTVATDKQVELKTTGVVKMPEAVKISPVVRKKRMDAPGIEVPRADTTKPDSAKSKTLTKEDIDLLIRAHEHGVTPEYVAELKQMGYTVSMEQAIRLVDHGVSAGFIREIQKEGYAQISLDRAVELIDHGVSAEFIHAVKAEGFPNLTLNEAVRLVDHGVNIGFIRDWKKKAGSQLELGDYIKLRDAGIDPS
ncbi:MAG TPA: M56 family metallopeptidase [Puia sp.]|nr:M56 family metallopeptidase [Puia sp.]